jgi:hypothetical protein
MTSSPLMRRGVLFLVAFTSSAPTLFAQDAAAVDAARRRQQEVILLQQRARLAAAEAAALRRRPLEWFLVEVDADSEDPLEVQPVRRARIAADWLDQVLFGQAESTAVRGELETSLAHEVEWLDEIYGLSAGQKQKLVLAGRGDIKRQFERIDEMKQKARSVSVDAANFQKLVDLQNTLLLEAAAWRKKLNAGQFGDETLFAKALRKVLSPEQVTRHAEWVRDHPVVVTRSWDLKVSR